MSCRLIISFISVLLILIPTSQTAHAFSLNVTKTIMSTVDGVVGTEKIPATTFPFGGKITSSGTACKVRFWVWQIVFGVPVPCPNCGFIPIAGTVIDVGPPGIPASKVFTFPGITKVYANNQQNKIGVMTLGIALESRIVKRITDKINSALARIPQIPVPNGWIERFSLSCPDGGIIRKIGTSK